MAENEVRIIRELSKSMVNKIAAGEVVERPANAVKELVENAIDAGATRIDVEVEKSGIEFLKVTDNGVGIPADQLEIALAPHATSKIAQPEDLFRIDTFGFRGEALASIAEISRMTLTSRAANATDGARIRSDGSDKSPVEFCGRNVGTTIELRDLFFNVPVRRRFLKSATTEYGQIKEAMTRLAIPRPEIAFSLRHNDVLDLDLPPANDMLDRIRKIFGDRVASRLVRVERTTTRNGVVFDGYIGRPDLWRGAGTMQYLFVNGRFFKDRALFSALKAAYQGLLKQGMFPVVFLNMETPLDFVDVNVHPTKQEVHFLDGQAMYSGVLHCVREMLLSLNHERRLDAETIAVAAGLPAPTSREQTPNAEERPREILFVPDDDPSCGDPNDPRDALDDDALRRGKQKLDDWFKVEKKERAPEPPQRGDDAPDPEEHAIQDANDVLAEATRRTPNVSPEQLTRMLQGRTSEFKKFPNLNAGGLRGKSGINATRPPEQEEEEAPTFPVGSFGGRLLSGAPRTSQDAAAPTAESLLERVAEPPRALSYDERRERVKANYERGIATKDRLIAQTSDGRLVVQLCARYLVMEAPDGIAIVDQHAVHERILYEKLRAGYEKGEIPVQRLLVPEVVDLSPAEYAFAMERKDLFGSLGVLLESFGGSSVVVNGYPALFQATAPADIFQTALGVLYEKRSSQATVADMVEGALRQMACKAAIKAGDKLSSDAVAELVAQAEMEAFAHHCPHGRPATVVFTTEKLDQFFIRD